MVQIDERYRMQESRKGIHIPAVPLGTKGISEWHPNGRCDGGVEECHGKVKTEGERARKEERSIDYINSDERTDRTD